MPAAVRLSGPRARVLRTQLDELAATYAAGPDPIDFVHRYTTADDQEVAALLASSLAFGRVASFTPVLESIFALSETEGGPASWVDRCAEVGDPRLQSLFYRWVRGPDLERFASTIGRFRARHGTIAQWIGRRLPEQGASFGRLLGSLIDELRTLSVVSTEGSFRQLSRGYRYLLPHPSSGSACKRWCMAARWMCRTSHPDLGLWPLDPRALVIPLDTHIHRVARMIGLTRRNDGSWRTAVEITANLRRIDPDDPTRFDFVLAHLGIDGQCRGKRVIDICSQCALVPVCKTGRSG